MTSVQIVILINACSGSLSGHVLTRPHMRRANFGTAAPESAILNETNEESLVVRVSMSLQQIIYRMEKFRHQVAIICWIAYAT